MTVALLKDANREAGEVLVAGTHAICDPGGALYIPEHGLLAVSDLHLEKGSSMARRGALLPPYDSAATLRRLQQTISRYAPRAIVSLGDSFHDADGSGRLPAACRDQLAAMAAGRDWFWITGNHDPVAPAGLPGETVDEFGLGALVFRHQPSAMIAEGTGEIAGHLHPCARIVRRGRSLRRRCFASDGQRMIMPAFGAFTGSLNVLDRAYDGLFSRDALMAYMLGADRIYAMTGAMLRPG